MKQLTEAQAGDQVAGYYAAALEFIDPKLNLDSPLGMIEAAADSQRMALGRQRGAQARARVSEISEALEFIRKSYTRVRRPPAAGDEEHPAGWDGAELTASESLRERELNLPAPEAGAAEHPAPGGNGNGHANGNGNSQSSYGDGNGNGQAQASAVPESASAEGAAVQTVTAEPPAELSADKRGANRFAAAVANHELNRGDSSAVRRSPLSRLFDADEDAPPCGDLLPEQLALPHLQGFALLIWQVLLAAAAGVVATRLVVWPAPSMGYEVSVGGGLGLIILGIASAACCGWLLWRQRLRSREVCMLAYATVSVVTLYMLAWWRALDPNVLIIRPPTTMNIILLCVVGGALIAWSHLFDARCRNSRTSA